ncbi:hypothetical protein BV898_16628 [Hypsibius exemplaris]|uniref:Receptor ligand binding region domain-containing protein n=1 Tax=Hypsibius exemplaris TaxID=2072580 RepID=A0A9X6NF69_HYPEX|nr:hypothetical protein BV898_16628 [Hypsibius exemplaris]
MASQLFGLFWGLLLMKTVNGDKPKSNSTIRMGIILNRHSGLPFDYDLLAVPIDLAVQRTTSSFGVDFQTFLALYDGGCQELAALNQTVIALNGSADVLLGPACTADLLVAAKLSTVLKVTLLTGGGSLLDSTAEWPFVTRTGYNTLSQWSFFERICRQFNWSNVAVFYENDFGATSASSGPSKQLISTPSLP